MHCVKEGNEVVQAGFVRVHTCIHIQICQRERAKEDSEKIKMSA